MYSWRLGPPKFRQLRVKKGTSLVYVLRDLRRRRRCAKNVHVQIGCTFFSHKSTSVFDFSPIGLSDSVRHTVAGRLFLRAKAATALVRLRNSVCLSICASVTQSKTVQARSPNFYHRKTLVAGTVKLFHKFGVSHSERGR